MTQEFEEWYGENHHRFGLGGLKSCHWVWKASREQLRLELLNILHPEGVKHPQQGEMESLLDKVRELAGFKAKLLSDEMADAINGVIDKCGQIDCTGAFIVDTKDAAKAAIEAIVREL